MKRWTLAACALLLGGCLDVADDRARFDETIGQSTIDSASISVVDGLAAVRVFKTNELTLWGQAPSLDATLNVAADGGGLWRIKLRNGVADVDLTASDERGPLEVTLVENPIPTVKEWSVELLAGTSVQLRFSPGDDDDLTPWRYVVFADIQSRIDGVQDIYSRMAEDPTVRFGLISGDLTEQGEMEQLLTFQREMRTLPFPLFSTLGNHELGINDHNFQKLFGRGNFSFEYRGVRFTLLDSASATLAPRVYDWLDDWLAQGADGLHMTMMHIPPLDPAGTRNGAFASRGEASKLVGMFGRAGVDLAVYGHVHSFYAFSTAGVPSYITGGGGGIPQRLDGIGRHYLSVDADPGNQSLDPKLIRVYPEE